VDHYRLLAGKPQWEKETFDNVWEGNVRLDIREVGNEG
jgi:hypothetical protein